MAELDEQREEVPTMPQLQADLIKRIAERVQFEPVLLGAPVGMGGEIIARTVAAHQAGPLLDPVLTGGESSEVAVAITQQLIASELPFPLDAINSQPGSLPELEAIADIYGRRMGVAIDIALGQLNPDDADWTPASALGAAAAHDLLTVVHTHRLSSETLWELRDLAATGLRLLLVFSPGNGARLLDKEGPFYGFGSYMEVPGVPLASWASSLGAGHDALAISELFQQASGKTAVMLEVLAHRRPGDRDLGDAWFRSVDAYEHEAETVMSLAPRVHPLAPRLLMAIAGGDPPYRGKRSDRTVLALGHLRDLDLVEQPAPRRWQIADPLLGAALRRLRSASFEVYPQQVPSTEV